VAHTDEPSGTRRDFLYFATAGAGAVAVGAGVWPLVTQMNPSADVRALSSIDVDISGVVTGTQLTVNWLGKPVFIRRRGPEEIEAARAVPLDDLVDRDARNPNIAEGAPATDENRTLDAAEEWLVQIGVCTHLGCVPIGDGAGDYGGWFCPCHGSHYDAAGRIRKGPAPENLPFRWRNSSTKPRSSSAKEGTDVRNSARPLRTEDRFREMALTAASHRRAAYDTIMIPTPKNLNWMWIWGIVLTFTLVLQIVTGIALVMHYTPHVDMAFASVEHIMRNVNGGWALRYMHQNGASLFFFAVYLHIFRGLYYGSYKAPREITWIIGMLIYLLMMAPRSWATCCPGVRCRSGARP
jgi:ubiquinol-cytochrome c reductase iron-sulfur subunit